MSGLDQKGTNFPNGINVPAKKLYMDGVALPLAGMLLGSATFDPSSLVDAAGVTSSGISVPGAAVGDFVLVAAPYDLQDILCTGYVQAANTVEIRLQNESGATVDLASGVWKVLVIKGA